MERCTHTLTHFQALQAQLDRVASSQPMKRQGTAADAEVRLRCVSVRVPSASPHALADARHQTPAQAASGTYAFV